MEELAKAFALLLPNSPLLSIIILALILFIILSGGFLLLLLSGKVRMPEIRLKRKSVNKLKPHDGCPYNVERMAEAQKAFERGQAIDVLHNQKVKQSMEEVEITMDKHEKMMTRLFYDVVKEITGVEDGAMKHPEAVYYKNLVWRALNKDCKDYVRMCIRENHFNEKSEIEFEAYITEQSNEIMEIITEFMDLYYNPVLISHEALFKKNQTIIPIMLADISKMFYRIRAISAERIQEAANILDAQGIFDEEIRKKELRKV
jgi:hypothetical protein